MSTGTSPRKRPLAAALLDQAAGPQGSDHNLAAHLPAQSTATASASGSAPRTRANPPRPLFVDTPADGRLGGPASSRARSPRLNGSDDEDEDHNDREDLLGGSGARSSASRGGPRLLPSTGPLSPHAAPSLHSIAIAADNDKYLDIDAEPADWIAEGSGRRVTYANFSTIDFLHDFAKERIRLKRLREHGTWLANLFDASQAWLVVAFVGVATGILAVFIALVEEWLADLKVGYCRDYWYLNRKFCCWMQEEEACSTWVLWGDVVTGNDDTLSVGPQFANATLATLVRRTEPHHEPTTTGSFLAAYLVYMAMATLFAFLAAFMCKHLAPYAAGSGIPEVKTILGGFIMRKFLGGWTLIVKTIGLPLATASGMSVGKEGPFVHLACCVGNIFPRLFTKFAKNEAKKREILSAAAAAGVSCAFGAPIGGVLFSLEEVSYYFPYKTMLRSFFSAMMAAVTLQVLNPYRTGKLVLFQVTYTKSWHSFELLFFMLLGALGGLFGALFIRLNLWVSTLRKHTWIRRHPVQEACTIALVTALISYVNVYLRAGSDKLVGSLFRACPSTTTLDPDAFLDDMHEDLCAREKMAATAGLLLIAAAAKIALTIVTFGTRVPCGIFIPTMCIGACVGRVLGMAVAAMARGFPTFFLFAACAPDEECITLGPYALLGAAAFLAGVTRMTVSLVVIMFEITGALTYVLPIMITVMVAKFVGDAFGHESIYDGLIRLNGYPFLDAKAEYIQAVHAGEVMTVTSDLAVIPAAGWTLADCETLVREDAHMGYPVVESAKSMVLVGFINRTELVYALEQARKRPDANDMTPVVFGPVPAASASAATSPVLGNASFGVVAAHAASGHVPVLDLAPWMDQTPITIVARYPMEMTIELFKKMGLRYVLITRNGQLLGLITKKDVLRHLGEMAGKSHGAGGMVVDQDLMVNRLVG
ncbi:hypothetical protein GGF32_008939 [Allomyces javanicus]|nr:hypothetical protein GGF32_008939 [Allomyces javanicus]